MTHIISQLPNIIKAYFSDSGIQTISEAMECPHK